MKKKTFIMKWKTYGVCLLSLLTGYTAFAQQKPEASPGKKELIVSNFPGDQTSIPLRNATLNPCTSYFGDEIWYFGEITPPGSTTRMKSAGIFFRRNNLTGEYVAEDYSGKSNVFSRENSISVTGVDSKGSVLFYADNSTLFNPKHEMLKDGNFLGNTSNADGLAVCYMGKNLYWLFSVSTDFGVGGLFYYIIDMDEENGMGRLLKASEMPQKKTQIEPEGGISEAIEVVPKAGKWDEYWLVYHNLLQGKVCVREITPSGVSGIVSSVTSISFTETNADRAMHMKVNPSYNQIAVCYEGATEAKMQLIDFNPESGMLEDSRTIVVPTSSTAGDFKNAGYVYGFSYSPSGRFLYMGFFQGGQLGQYDLQEDVVRLIKKGDARDCKLGPDGKVYVIRSNNTAPPYVGVVNTPDLPADDPAFSYDVNGILLSGISTGRTGQSKCFSMGITYPGVCPDVTNNPPIARPDVVYFNEAATTVTAYPLENDDNGGDDDAEKIFLVDASLMNEDDAQKVTVDFDPITKTVTLKAVAPFTFTKGDQFKVKYVIRDSGGPGLFADSEILFVAIGETMVYYGRQAAGSNGTLWSVAANWKDNLIPGLYDIAMIEGSTGVDQVNVDLMATTCLSVQIKNGKKVIINANASLVTNAIEGENLDATSIQLLTEEGAGASKNANLIVKSGIPPLATIHKFLRTSIITENTEISAGSGTWQMMTIPIEQITASPTYNNTWVDRYNPASDRWERQYDNSILKRGAGYAVNYREPHTFTFKGQITNSNTNFLLNTSGNGLNLIGNPFTASINLENASSWAMANIYSTFWVWNLDKAQYEAFTLGSIAQSDKTLSSLQGFFVEVKDLNSPAGITIPYSATTVNNTLLRSAKKENYRMVKLNLEGKNYNDEVYIREMPGTSSGYDDGFDGKKYVSFVAGTPCMYTIEEREQYNQISTTDRLDEMLLGLIPGEDQEYTLKVELQGDFQGIELLDLKTGESYDLITTNDIVINTSEFDSEERFKLIFAPEAGTSVSSEKVNMPVQLWTRDNSLYVRSQDLIKTISIYTISGTEIYRSAEDKEFCKITLPENSHEMVYIVKITTDKETIVEKILNK